MKGHRGAFFPFALCTAALAFFAACSDDSSGLDKNTPTRSFALGFTDFPSARTIEAVQWAYATIARDGDLAVMHFDDGVPWQEALDGIPYAQGYLDELAFKRSSIPSGHLVYLALTPLSFMRDSLAKHRGGAGSEPLEHPWDTLRFDDQRVITAFGNHCEFMIARFQPDFFAYAIEANMLAANEPARWSEFVTLADSVYSRVKEAHPALPVFITLQNDYFRNDSAGQSAAINQVLSFTDCIAVSTYPFSSQPDPDLLPPDFFTAIAGLAPGKPFAISETSWPAEPVEAPYPIVIPASDTTQLAYATRLLEEIDRLDGILVNWFFTRDYDDFWIAELQHLPDAALLRLWKDTGLYDGAGAARPALGVWREHLSRNRRPID